MRVTRISVKGLFGIFDHSVRLNLADRVTIVHGPNGFGKTVLLKMIDALLGFRTLEFRSTPFELFCVDFDNESQLCIRRRPGLFVDSEKEKRAQLFYQFTAQGNVEEYVGRGLAPEDLSFPISMLEREISELARIGPDTWFYSPTNETLGLDEILERFADDLPVQKRLVEEPPWVKSLKSAIPIRLIETQRLLSFRYARRQRGFEHQAPLLTLAVAKYSEELANAIQAKLTEYASLSQSLDRTFPSRLVKTATADRLTMEELRKRLAELEDKRSRLMAVGFLDKEQEIDFRDLQQIDESNQNVLSVYVSDVQQKLSVFDELTNKIDLFVKIISGRFLYKQLTINKKDGFLFRTLDGKTLPPSNLSSGEQHEIVLLYELLFKVSRNSLILIDEPELSLHIAWQQVFLRDLLDITQLAGIDVLIATHSPQIINDRWDLTVELQGPKL
jgi:predicted ATP-binding protein involved in virulence